MKDIIYTIAVSALAIGAIGVIVTLLTVHSVRGFLRDVKRDEEEARASDEARSRAEEAPGPLCGSGDSDEKTEV